MSLSIAPVEVVKIRDPRTDLRHSREYAVFQGGSEVTMKPFTSTSFSNSSFQFSCPPPSPQIITSRYVQISVPVHIDFVGTSGGAGNLLQPGRDAFRAYPLSSVLTTLQATINNTSVSINTSDVIQSLLRYKNPVEMSQERQYSLTPHAMDITCNYNDLVDANNNPLGTLFEAVPGSATGRGAFPMNITVNSATNASIDAVLTECLYLSPFEFTMLQNSIGFYGVQTMDFNFTWSATLGNMWSHAPQVGAVGSTLTSIAVTLEKPTLLFTYITPKQLDAIPLSIPNVYPYSTIDRYFTDDSAARDPGVITTITSNNIQLQSVPNRVYMAIVRRNADKRFDRPDNFYPIQNVVIQFGNRQGLLSSASQEQLYNMSLKNGLDMSWEMFSGGPSHGGDFTAGAGLAGAGFALCGAPICLEFGSDIGLDDTLAPGVLETIQFQANVQYQNLSAESVQPTLLMIFANEGTFTVVDNRSITQVGVISRSDVLNSRADESVPFAAFDQMEMNQDFMGGRGNFKRFFSQHILPLIKQVGTHLGNRYGNRALGILDRKADKAFKHAEDYLDGSALVGGRGPMTRAVLKQHMRR